jgi:hypothetical protein
MNSIELIDNTGNTLLHTVDKTIDVRSNYIDVHGAVQGEGNLGDYGKFKACYRVFWEPGPPQIRITSIEPATIVAREPTSITVQAEDWYNSSNLIDGRVLIDGVGEVGSTNAPFNFTFNSNSSSVGGKVTAPGYVDAELRFPLTFPPLEVRSEPSTIEISSCDRLHIHCHRVEANVTIYATDPKTHKSVAGQVVTNEGDDASSHNVIGNTNEQMTHAFFPATAIVDLELATYDCVYPTVTVTTPGYSDTVVPINFTGDLSQLRCEPIIIDSPDDSDDEDIPVCPEDRLRCP